MSNIHGVNTRKMAEAVSLYSQTVWIPYLLKKCGEKELAKRFEKNDPTDETKHDDLHRAYLADRADRAYLADRADRAYRAYRADLADRADRADRADLAYRADRADRAYLADLKVLVAGYIQAFEAAGGSKQDLIVPNLDACILGDLQAKKWFLEMGNYHGSNSCGTTHCRAGGAQVEAGLTWLPKIVGEWMAGAMIYVASTGRIPDFFASEEDAMKDIKKCAKKDPLPAKE